MCIINTVQALCIFATSVFALDSCLATKITSFTIFFIKCMAFHYLPFVNTDWQLHYLYAKSDMWMLYIRKWGHTYILTFTREAWLFPPLLALHALQCDAILKHGCIIFSQKGFNDHLSNSGCSWISTFPFLPYEPIIRVMNHSLVLEVWSCFLEWSSWRLSQISSCGVWSYDLRSTPWKNWLQTETSQIQILVQTPEQKASRYAGVGDRLGTLHIPGK